MGIVSAQWLLINDLGVNTTLVHTHTHMTCVIYNPHQGPKSEMA